MKEEDKEECYIYFLTEQESSDFSRKMLEIEHYIDKKTAELIARKERRLNKMKEYNFYETIDLEEK